MGFIDFFQTLLSKVGISLGGRALSRCLGWGVGSLLLAAGFSLFTSEWLLFSMTPSDNASNSLGEVQQRRPVLPAPAREPAPFESELMAAVEPFLNNGAGSSQQQPSQGGLSVTSSESDTSSSMGEEATPNASGGPEPEAAEAAGAPIPDFRAAHQAEESELFNRIGRLEGLLGHQIITRLEPGAYLREVRENLENTSNLGQEFYEKCLEFETFELSVLEKKLTLQDLLFGLFLEENEEKIRDLIELSPCKDRDIRAEAYDFLEEQIPGIETCSVRDPSRKRALRELLQQHLHFLIDELRAQGHDSPTYKGFLDYLEI